MTEFARLYFVNLFSTRYKSGNLDLVLSRLDQCITVDANLALTTAYMEEEMVKALKGMGAVKALGVDGFSILFF